ncbi:MAG: DNA-3-methyladenine glycosylase [Actinomycetia bacterium]|nr:DNA-3-methyladenine glycosylase [Actinomycetes bacterium]
MRRSELDQPAQVVAQTLLGALLTHSVADGVVSVRITEVEAYGGVGADPASHAHRGRTPGNEVMFAMPGTLYVYFVYGMHWCANVVCGPGSDASAVLLRGAAVVEGVGLSRRRRPTVRRDSDLAKGPANLAAALGLSGSANGLDLLRRGSPVRLSKAGSRPVETKRVGVGPRVGVGRATDRPWRWWIIDDPTVSRYRAGRGRTPR